MLFAGFTAVIAKIGLGGISGEMGLSVRTLFVSAFILIFAWAYVPPAAWLTLGRSNWVWLGVSGFTTSLSWIFYYKALKQGDVASVALIDKGSVVVAILLACIVLKEALTPKLILGSVCIVAGLLIIARK